MNKEKIPPKSVYIGAYFFAELFLITVFIFVLFPMLWGLAYNSFTGATILSNGYMFGVIPFFPVVAIRQLAKYRFVYFLSEADSVLGKVATSFWLGFLSSLLLGVVMVMLIFLVDIFG